MEEEELDRINIVTHEEIANLCQIYQLLRSNCNDEQVSQVFAALAQHDELSNFSIVQRTLHESTLNLSQSLRMPPSRGVTILKNLTSLNCISDKYNNRISKEIVLIKMLTKTFISNSLKTKSQKSNFNSYTSIKNNLDIILKDELKMDVNKYRFTEDERKNPTLNAVSLNQPDFNNNLAILPEKNTNKSVGLRFNENKTLSFISSPKNINISSNYSSYEKSQKLKHLSNLSENLYQKDQDTTQNNIRVKPNLSLKQNIEIDEKNNLDTNTRVSMSEKLQDSNKYEINDLEPEKELKINIKIVDNILNSPHYSGKNVESNKSQKEKLEIQMNHEDIYTKTISASNSIKNSPRLRTLTNLENSNANIINTIKIDKTPDKNFAKSFNTKLINTENGQKEESRPHMNSLQKLILQDIIDRNNKQEPPLNFEEQNKSYFQSIPNTPEDFKSPSNTKIIKISAKSTPNSLFKFKNDQNIQESVKSQILESKSFLPKPNLTNTNISLNEEKDNSQCVRNKSVRRILDFKSAHVSKFLNETSFIRNVNNNKDKISTPLRSAVEKDENDIKISQNSRNTNKLEKENIENNEFEDKIKIEYETSKFEREEENKISDTEILITKNKSTNRSEKTKIGENFNDKSTRFLKNKQKSIDKIKDSHIVQKEIANHNLDENIDNNQLENEINVKEDENISQNVLTQISQSKNHKTLNKITNLSTKSKEVSKNISKNSSKGKLRNNLLINASFSQNKLNSSKIIYKNFKNTSRNSKIHKNDTKMASINPSYDIFDIPPSTVRDSTLYYVNDMPPETVLKSNQSAKTVIPSNASKNQKGTCDESGPDYDEHFISKSVVNISPISASRNKSQKNNGNLDNDKQYEVNELNTNLDSSIVINEKNEHIKCLNKTKKKRRSLYGNYQIKKSGSKKKRFSEDFTRNFKPIESSFKSSTKVLPEKSSARQLKNRFNDLNENQTGLTHISYDLEETTKKSNLNNKNNPKIPKNTGKSMESHELINKELNNEKFSHGRKLKTKDKSKKTAHEIFSKGREILNTDYDKENQGIDEDNVFLETRNEISKKVKNLQSLADKLNEYTKNLQNLSPSYESHIIDPSIKENPSSPKRSFPSYISPKYNLRKNSSKSSPKILTPPSSIPDSQPILQKTAPSRLKKKNLSKRVSFAATTKNISDSENVKENDQPVESPTKSNKKTNKLDLKTTRKQKENKIFENAKNDIQLDTKSPKYNTRSSNKPKNIQSESDNNSNMDKVKESHFEIAKNRKNDSMHTQKAKISPRLEFNEIQDFSPPDNLEILKNDGRLNAKNLKPTLDDHKTISIIFNKTKKKVGKKQYPVNVKLDRKEREMIIKSYKKRKSYNIDFGKNKKSIPKKAATINKPKNEENNKRQIRNVKFSPLKNRRRVFLYLI